MFHQRLGVSDQERFNTYQALFLADLDKDLVKTISRALEFSMPLGSSRFQQQIEKALGRKLGQACRGRPRIPKKLGDKHLFATDK